MRLLLVARKSLLEILREWQLLLLVVLLPLVFVGITAYGYSAPLLVTHPVLVMGPEPPGELLAKELEAQAYADGRPMFKVSRVQDRDTADAALMQQEVTALVIVYDQARAKAGNQDMPGDSAFTDHPFASGVAIRGDALNARFYRASILLEDVINRYADRSSGRAEIIRIAENPHGTDGPRTEFDIYAPGMMVFALLMIIPQTAMLVAREMRSGTLQRLRLTRVRAWELLGGVGLAQMIAAVVQVVVVFLSALAMGFNNQGSLWLAIVVGLAISFSAIGLGLVVACLVENDSQAINVGSTVTMLLVFVSGSFYQLPSLTVFTLAGHQIDLFDVFPATSGFLALQQVLVYGAGLKDVAFRLGVTLLLSLAYLSVGVAVFRHHNMRDG